MLAGLQYLGNYLNNMKQDLINELGLQGIKGNFERAGEAQILETEMKLKLRLPEEYKKFLREFGASLFTQDVIFTPKEPSPWAVDGNERFDIFYGVSTDPGFDLCRVNTRLKGDIPAQTIAIGHDPGSNLILLSLDTNQVRFFDKESGMTFLIAANFQDFLKSFHRR